MEEEEVCARAICRRTIVLLLVFLPSCPFILAFRSLLRTQGQGQHHTSSFLYTRAPLSRLPPPARTPQPPVPLSGTRYTLK
jgi:hypothetical protein